MKASFFESIRYVTSQNMPSQWPLPPGCYEPDVGGQAFRSAIERLALVEELGFDWVSFSEHHYSSRILSPSPIVMASHMAAHLHKITIAVLGPIIPLNNPVRVAEELAMLDNLTQGRLVVGLLRGTTNEYLVYGVKPEEARETTTEGMELILKAWTEPYPFGWEGCYFQYRTVSVWPRPLQQPYSPTYALGTSRESCEFAARHRLGLGVSFGPFEVVIQATRYYRAQCALYGWEPTPEQIIYRGNIPTRTPRRRCNSDNSRRRCRFPCDRASVMPSRSWIPVTSQECRGQPFGMAPCRRRSSAVRRRS